MFRYQLSFIAIILLTMTFGCQPDTELMPISEAVTVVSPPIYEAKSPFEGQEISTLYRQTDSSEGTVIAYFVQDSQGEQVRVARLIRCTACALIGSSEEITRENVTLGNPFNQEVNVCNILPNQYGGTEPFSGEEYITCFYWMNGEGYKYRLYSVWPLEETTTFLENLKVVK